MTNPQNQETFDLPELRACIEQAVERAFASERKRRADAWQRWLDSNSIPEAGSPQDPEPGARCGSMGTRKPSHETLERRVFGILWRFSRRLQSRLLLYNANT